VGSNPTGGMDVCLLCVLSGRGLCDELITRPEESYRLCRVVVYDQETSYDKEAIACAGLQSQRKQQTYILDIPPYSICISSNSEGSKKLPVDGRLLLKHVAASI
jgi:hypothetical protein